MLQRLDQQLGDHLGAFVAPSGPIAFIRRHRALERVAPSLVNAHQRPQQRHARRVVRRVRVEGAHEIEVLPEPRLPDRGVDRPRRRIDQSHARTPAHQQDFHLGVIDLAKRLRGIDHVKNARALDQRTEEFALLGKHFVAAVDFEKTPERVQRITRRVLEIAQPGQRAAGILKPRRVKKSHDRLTPEFDRELLARRRLPRPARDPQPVVLDQRRDGRGLPRVHRAHAGKDWRPVIHVRSTRKKGSACAAAAARHAAS